MAGYVIVNEAGPEYRPILVLFEQIAAIDTLPLKST